MSAPPNENELEVSVFGPGFGECICVHVGAGDWIVIDSCLDEAERNPAATTYLASLGFGSEAVRLIVVTHWDDDHIRGIARLVESCAAADVACSSALAREDVVQFVISQSAALGGSETGVDELRTILRLMQRRGKTIIWAKANTPLFPRPPGPAPVVTALSPSDEAFQRGVTELIERATQLRSAVPRRYRAPEGPNGASVATSVRRENQAVLLGADLEKSTNPESGWDAVIAHAKPPVRASVVKVPHHGSEDAHHDGMWSELLATDSFAILTPMVWGSNSLPAAADVLRIKETAGRVFVTSTPSLVRSRKGGQVDKLVRVFHGERIRRLRGWGQVRLRRNFDDPPGEWRVELFGDAAELNAA